MGKFRQKSFIAFSLSGKTQSRYSVTIYEQNGKDKIVVCVYIVSSIDESIEICIDIENGRYLFAW